jgi:hypothetical protein
MYGDGDLVNSGILLFLMRCILNKTHWDWWRVKLLSHSSNDATTDEEDSGKERSGGLHLPETDTIEEDTDNLGNVT